MSAYPPLLGPSWRWRAPASLPPPTTRIAQVALMHLIRAHLAHADTVQFYTNKPLPRHLLSHATARGPMPGVKYTLTSAGPREWVLAGPGAPGVHMRNPANWFRVLFHLTSPQYGATVVFSNGTHVRTRAQVEGAPDSDETRARFYGCGVMFGSNGRGPTWVEQRCADE